MHPMRQYLFSAAFLTAFFAAGFPTKTFSTMFIATSENQMILESQRICAVKVKDFDHEPKNGMVMTVAHVEPIKSKDANGHIQVECYKGSTSEPFDVTY